MIRTRFFDWLAPLAQGIAAALLATTVHAQVPPVQEPSSEKDMKAALMGGWSQGKGAVV